MRKITPNHAAEVAHHCRAPATKDRFLLYRLHYPAHGYTYQHCCHHQLLHEFNLVTFPAVAKEDFLTSRLLCITSFHLVCTWGRWSLDQVLLTSSHFSDQFISATLLSSSFLFHSLNVDIQRKSQCCGYLWGARAAYIMLLGC